MMSERKDAVFQGRDPKESKQVEQKPERKDAVFHGVPASASSESRKP
jgi:hypothetical protein